VLAIILFVVFSPVKPGMLSPSIEDSIEIEDYSTIGISQNTTDDRLENSEVVVDEGSTEFYFDDTGEKHYVISAIDKPILK